MAFWRPGDRVGCVLDMDQKKVHYFLNDKPMLDAAKYAQTFDALVLGAEGSLAGVDALLDDIVAGPSPVASPTKANGVSPFEAAV